MAKWVKPTSKWENLPAGCLPWQKVTELQEGIRDAEEHLQAARRIYNANVTNYNTSIKLFPGKLLAGKRSPKEFFEAEDYKKEDVKMQF